MKFLVIGCGSMGRRRIRDLKRLEAGEVFAFDADPNRLREVEDKFGVETCESLTEALKKNPDVFVVSVFPSLHAKYIKVAVEAGKPVFSEAPLAIEWNDVLEIEAQAEASKSFVAPSCSLLHHPLNQAVKEARRITSDWPAPGILFALGDPPCHLAAEC